MELKIWSKTFLNVYRSLQKITEAIDKIILTSGLNSNLDAYYNANKILELTERKIELINLKLLIEETLNSLDKNDTKLLVLKYVDKAKASDIAKIFNISNRTFFRKSNMALKSFELNLKRQGYTHEKISNMLEKEVWIKSLFNKLNAQELNNLPIKKSLSNELNNEDDINDNKLFNLAYNSYKKLETSNMYL